MPALTALRATRSRPSPVAGSTTIADRPLRGRRMNVPEELLDLNDRVALGETHFHVELQAPCRLARVLGLELLVLLLGVQEPDHDFRHHGPSRAARTGARGRIGCLGVARHAPAPEARDDEQLERQHPERGL